MTGSQASRPPTFGAAERNHDHKVWVVVGLALGPAVALGLARFAYALLLPAMRTELHWSLTTAGAMNSANALGYLAGALATARLARRYGAHRTFLTGLGVTVASMLLTAATGDIVVLLGLRALAGVSGAVTFVAGAGLVAEAAAGESPHRTAMLLGIYFAGGGAGIVISGLSVPALLGATASPAGWRWGWVLLGALGAAALVPAWLAARSSGEPPPQPQHDRRWPARSFVALLGSYALFGAGYIAYMTFIVAFLHDGGARTGEITAFWAVLGAASILGAFCWVRPIARSRGGRGTSIVLAVVAAGAILPLVSRSAFAAMASAILFGGSFLAVVTAVTAVARRSLRPHHWTPAIAALTVAFAAGQCVGPVLTGVVSQGEAGLRIGLGVSAALLVAAAVVALGQRHLEDHPGHENDASRDVVGGVSGDALPPRLRSRAGLRARITHCERRGDHALRQSVGSPAVPHRSHRGRAQRVRRPDRKWLAHRLNLHAALRHSPARRQHLRGQPRSRRSGLACPGSTR